MIETIRLRAGETHRIQGANFRGQRLPRYVLVNMGQGKVAFGRPADLANVIAYADILKRVYPGLAGKITSLPANFGIYELQFALSEQGQAKYGELFKGDWQTAQVSIDDLNPEALKTEAGLNTAAESPTVCLQVYASIDLPPISAPPQHATFGPGPGDTLISVANREINTPLDIRGKPVVDNTGYQNTGAQKPTPKK